jgi:hypothetical protein
MRPSLLLLSCWWFAALACAASVDPTGDEPVDPNAAGGAGQRPFSLPDWTSTPGRQSCNVTARVDTIRRWARDRHVALQARFPM